MLGESLAEDINHTQWFLFVLLLFVLILWDTKRKAGPTLVGEDGTKQKVLSKDREAMKPLS